MKLNPVKVTTLTNQRFNRGFWYTFLAFLFPLPAPRTLPVMDESVLDRGFADDWQALGVDTATVLAKLSDGQE